MFQVRGGGGETGGGEGTQSLGNPHVEPKPCITFPNEDNENKSKSHSAPKYGLLFMDQFCEYHGGYVASKARDVYGVATIHALSTYVCGYLSWSTQSEDGGSDGGMPTTAGQHSEWKIPSPDEFDDWREKIPFEVLAIICESDAGLDEAELLAEAMNVRYHNGYNAARRDKFLMNDALSQVGLRTVKQKMCKTLEEAVEFATVTLGMKHVGDEEDVKNPMVVNEVVDEEMRSNSWNGGVLGSASNTPMDISKQGKYCVIKPKRGVASDDVYFCTNVQEVKTAFQKIHGTSVFGSISSEKNDDVVSACIVSHIYVDCISNALDKVVFSSL
jgi:hypothetical protein